LLEWVGPAAALAGTAAVAYVDARTGFMPDEVTYAMIGIGLLWLPFAFPLSEAIFYYAIAAAVFVVTLAAYLFGQLGGGDVKLFTGLALLTPVYPAVVAPLSPLGPVAAPYPFIISVFFLAAVVAMVFVSGHYTLRLWRDRREISGWSGKVGQGLLYCAVIGLLMLAWSVFNFRMLVFGIPLLLGGFVLAFKNDILKRYVVMYKPVAALNDDDVLASELYPERLKAALGVGARKTFTVYELRGLKARARKAGIKRLLVAENLPRFGPFILASLLVNFLLGDALLWVLFS
jgi:Flp pilus assembly protein protease CpaA